MKILLIGSDLEENLALGYLASSLEAAGHEALLASYNGPDDALRVLSSAEGADLSGLSLAYQAKAPEYFDLARRLKERYPETPVIAGGHFASCAAREILEHHPAIDFIVIHEGEKTIAEIAALGVGLLRRLGEIPGLAYRGDAGIVMTPARPKIEDLDSLPLPKRGPKAYLLAGVPTAYMLGSRGCVNSCNYCCISALHELAPGSRLRQRNPERIADEMELLYRDHGIRHFVFHDDNFLVPSRKENHARLEGFSRAIASRGLDGIGLTVKCSPADIDEPLVARLRSLGVVRVFLGIESASDAILDSFNRKQRTAQNDAAIALCEAHGISVQFNIMTFNPESTFATIEADIEYLKRHLSNAVNFCRTELFAGTPLEKKMIAEGRADGDYVHRGYRYTDEKLNTACYFFRKMFYERCWAKSSLMLSAVSIDHLGALLAHHYNGKEIPSIAAKITDFRIRVNRDTVKRLASLVGAVRSETDLFSRSFKETMRRQVNGEKASLARFRREYAALTRDIEELIDKELGLVRNGNGGLEIAPARKGLARHAKATLAALSLSGFLLTGVSCSFCVCEYAPPPLSDSDSDGLYDRYEEEIFGTNPLLPDSDGDGIMDGEEDHDGDGITNLQYQDENLDPFEY